MPKTRIPHPRASGLAERHTTDGASTMRQKPRTSQYHRLLHKKTMLNLALSARFSLIWINDVRLRLPRALKSRRRASCPVDVWRTYPVRFHGHRPSISTSSEKLKRVRIVMINPNTPRL
jgi:hypothetical protein